MDKESQELNKMIESSFTAINFMYFNTQNGSSTINIPFCNLYVYCTSNSYYD